MQGCPRAKFRPLLSHPSKLPNRTWLIVSNQASYHADDGHICRMTRGVKHTGNVSKLYDHLPESKVK